MVVALIHKNEKVEIKEITSVEYILKTEGRSVSILPNGMCVLSLSSYNDDDTIIVSKLNIENWKNKISFNNNLCFNKQFVFWQDNTLFDSLVEDDIALIKNYAFEIYNFGK